MNNQLPNSTRKPGIYIGYNTSISNRNLPENPQRLLIVAQRTAAGSVAALAATAVFSDTDAAAYFGPGSAAHLMARAAIKANPYLDLTVIPVDDAGAGVAATGTVTITGPATGTGVLTLFVGQKKVELAITSGDSANTIAAALDTALDGIAELPVTSAAVNGVVTLTAKNKGTVGNTIKLSAATSAAGTTVALVAMANGASDPDIAAALAAVFSVRYQLIATQFTDATNLGKLRDHLDLVSGKIEQRGARGYAGLTGSYAASISVSTGTPHERLCYAWSRGSRALPCEVGAAYSAYRASVDDPAMPLDDDVLPGLPVPPLMTDWPSRQEQESALHNGLIPLYVGADNRLRINRAITSYLTDASGNPDDTLLDDNPIPILDYTRDVVRAIPRPKKCTAKRAAAYRDLIYTQLKKLEKAEILMDIDKYKDRLQVIANPDDRPAGWFRVIIPAPYVPGLHIVDTTIELYL